METIYIDRLFLINLIIDYLLALGSARVCGLKLRRPRYLISAVFGALYAAVSVFPGTGFMSAMPVKLATGILMSLISFGKEQKFWRCTAVFFSLSALFGGAVWALSQQSGDSLGSTLYVPLSMPVLVLSFALIYALLSLVFRRTAKDAGRRILDVKFSFDGRDAELRALCDSGNTLYDPITGSSVVICSAESLAEIIPECLDISDPAELISLPCYSGRLRLIPYSAVGTAGGLLAAFRPDELTVDGKPRDDILIAISPNGIKGDGFDSVISIQEA